ncbi:MAG TPA: hypothetical protein VI451_21245, partial [Anaerolineales bacterium]|nr:hypothetical protein [Anaerolineales bacterium]
MNNILTQLGQLGVIPIVVLEDAAHAQSLGRALLDGGLPCAEITFRTAAAEASIRAMSSAYPDMLVGAGTVLTVVQAETAVAAGAKFIEATFGGGEGNVALSLANFGLDAAFVTGLPKTPIAD